MAYKELALTIPYQLESKRQYLSLAILGIVLVTILLSGYGCDGPI